MFKNYLKIAFRNIIRQKGYSFINIFGLAIGMASAILIMLYVQNEFSYDTFHEKGDQIYRLERKGIYQGKEYHVSVTAHPQGPTLVSEFPEIEKAVRIFPLQLMVKDNFNVFTEERIFFADKDIFNVFTFPLVSGNANNALTEPNTIVISEEMSHKYFGEENPLEKTLTIQWENTLISFKVTGVMENIPANSHFHAGFFASYSSFDQLLGANQLNAWLSNSIYTYLFIKKNTNISDLSSKFPAFIEKYMGKEVRQFLGNDVDINKIFQFKLTRVDKIYLYGNLPFDIEPGSDIKRIYIFSAIALLILVIAGINFMNLSTARSARRAKEVGLRKVSGANRNYLIRQFLGESIILSFLALILAIILVELFLPTFNAFTQKALAINYLLEPKYSITFILLALFVGIFSGSYPALYLSKFNPAAVLKSTQSSSVGNGSPILRKILVVFQFAISVILIIGTSVVMKQLNYIQNKKLGFNKEHVLVIPCQDNSVFSKFDLIKNEFKKNRQIVSVGGSTKIPGNRNFSDSVYKLKEASDDDFVILRNFWVDEDFIPTMGIELAAGRNFSREFKTDASDGFIINEAAAKKFGWLNAEEAIGNEISRPIAVNPFQFEHRKIVGVVKDFHYRSLHTEIQPLIMIMGTNLYYVSVKIKADDISNTIQYIRTKWEEFSSGFPFEYFFLDDNFNRQYIAEKRTQDLFSAFSFLAIFIASLGLFGMASYTTEQRTKEIGVRKVLGASVFSIILLLSKEFTKWVIIANIFAWPVGYWLMSRWLQNFNYHIDLGISLFIIAMAIALGIAVITVSFQAIKAAIADPVNALKYE